MVGERRWVSANRRAARGSSVEDLLSMALMRVRAVVIDSVSALVGMEVVAR